MLWMNNDKLAITFAGGVNEVGHNCLNCENDNSAVIIDCGIKPLPGADWTYNPPPRLDLLDELLKKKKKIVAIISHFHLDHSGAVRELFARNIPVFISQESVPFTVRYSDTLKIPPGAQFQIYNKNNDLEIGDLKISFFPVQHSIPGAHAVLIKCGKKSILHTGDFKMNGMENSLEKSRATFQEIKNKAGEIDCLILNVLNIEMDGFTPREQLTLDSIERVISYSSGRVIITFFSSNIERMRGILKIAERLNRTVGVSGRNMTDSYIQITGRRPYRDGKIVLITGSQGENNSALSRMVNGEHALSSSGQDTDIFSSRGIPGNEEKIKDTVEKLHKSGATVIMHHEEAKKLGLSFNPEETIAHSSGHGYRCDQQDVVKITKPGMIVPFNAPEESCEMFERLIGGKRTQRLSVGETLKI